MIRRSFAAWIAFAFSVVGATSCYAADAPSSGSIRIGVFQVDATPPLGTPVAYALVRKIEDPLSARGVVLLGIGKPIVLCAVDWIGIANGGQDVWRQSLAKAADTTVDRVAVHVLHQHDGVRCDFSSEELLAPHGLTGKRFDVPFVRKTIADAAEAVRAAVSKAQPVTHLGVGQAAVEKVASNRRILGPDGRVAIARSSSYRIPEPILSRLNAEAQRQGYELSASRVEEALAAPEGVIDPLLKMLTFFNGDEPLVSLSYYATHPQSYFGKGDVTAEFVGLARAEHERTLRGLTLVHFNGASGDIAAGKYNDGSPEMRVVLTQRMTEGMRRAWQATKKMPLTAAECEWRVQPVKLPVASHLNAEKLGATLSDSQAPERDRLTAASKLAFLLRMQRGEPVELSCLKLANVYVLHMPGELFVEYQLAAQKMRPDATVCMAAYGEYGTGYIGTKVAYAQGGYETQPSSSNTAPEVEQVLMDGMKELLRPSASRAPLMRVIDLEVGESAEVELSNGKKTQVKLVELREGRDSPRDAVRRAEVTVAIDGKPVQLTSATYHLPTDVDRCRIDCPITKGYYTNAGQDSWGLVKAARLRLWPADSPMIEPEEFLYPVKQRWFATATQMANEPTYVDGVERPSVRKIYYHSGEDIGGAEGEVEVVAATDGLVVSKGLDVLDGHRRSKENDSPVGERYDVVYLLDARGWYYRYSHLQSIDSQVVPGRLIRKGDRVGVLGKEGASGGWSHLHFEIKSRQPSGKWGTQASYGMLWEAYLRQYDPKLIAVARPHHLLWAGESAALDGGRSWSKSGDAIVYAWKFSDGSTASGARQERHYSKPGVYSEILQVTDKSGNTDYDFAIVQVLDKDRPQAVPQGIHASYSPSLDLKPNDPITFQVRTFGPFVGHETWDFGDGTPTVEVRSDGNAKALAKDGYAKTVHRYERSGHYLASVYSVNERGETATARLHIHIP